jgi:hypothetical protein
MLRIDHDRGGVGLGGAIASIDGISAAAVLPAHHPGGGIREPAMSCRQSEGAERLNHDAGG